MFELLQVFQIIVSIVMIVLVLLQPKESGLTVSLTGNTQANFERRGPAKTLHNLTVIAATLFAINSVVLFLIA